MKVLEESQVCADYVLEIYVREMTLRRAQNQVTFLLSIISALKDKPLAKPLLESINILVLGVLNESNQRYMVDEYDLGEDNKHKLELIANDTRYMHTFLLVNRMQQDATTALIKTYVPDSVRDGKLFKVVDVETEDFKMIFINDLLSRVQKSDRSDVLARVYFVSSLVFFVCPFYIFFWKI